MTMLVGLGLCLAACAPPPTPLPVDVAQATAPDITTIAGTAPVVVSPPSVAVGPWAGPFAPLAQMRGSASASVLERVPDDLTPFALVVDYGIVPGWEPLPATHTVSLALNSALPPLDDSAVRQAVRDALVLVGPPSGVPGQVDLRPATTDPEAQALHVREALANTGHPDGVTLRVRLGAPGVFAPPAALEAANITLDVLPGTGPLAPADAADVHLALFTWATEDARAAWPATLGADAVLDLAQLPLSIWRAPGQRVVFTADGWPTLAGP